MIQKIKAEIERRIALYKKSNYGISIRSDECKELLDFIESLEEEPTIKCWVARAKCERIFLFETKPTRASDFWFEKNVHFQEIDSHAFPDLTWEDEPIEVELTINRV